MTDQEMRAAATAAGFWAERIRGSVLVWLPMRRRTQWVREAITGCRRAALTRAIERAHQEMANQKTPNKKGTGPHVRPL